MSKSTQSSFDELKRLEQVADEARRRARQARAQWEQACRNDILKQVPEIEIMLDRIVQLQAELDTARKSLGDLLESTGYRNQFREFL